MQYYKNHFDFINKQFGMTDLTSNELTEICLSIIDKVEKQYPYFKHENGREITYLKLQKNNYLAKDDKELIVFVTYGLSLNVLDTIDSVKGISEPRLTSLDLDLPDWYFKKGLAFLAGARYLAANEYHEQGMRKESLLILSRLDKLGTESGSYVKLEMPLFDILGINDTVKRFYEILPFFQKAKSNAINDTAIIYQQLITLWGAFGHEKEKYSKDFYFDWASKLNLASELPLLKFYSNSFNSNVFPKTPLLDKRVEALNKYIKKNKIDISKPIVQSHKKLWENLQKYDNQLFCISVDPKVYKQANLKFKKGTKKNR